MATDDIARFIDARMQDMITQPRPWASTPESLEFQLLTLLEIRGLLLGHEPVGPRDVAWRRLFALTEGETRRLTG